MSLLYKIRLTISTSSFNLIYLFQMNSIKNLHYVILIWGWTNCFIYRNQAKLHFKKSCCDSNAICWGKRHFQSWSSGLERRLPRQQPAFVSRPGNNCFFIFLFNFWIIAIFSYKIYMSCSCAPTCDKETEWYQL